MRIGSSSGNWADPASDRPSEAVPVFGSSLDSRAVLGPYGRGSGVPGRGAPQDGDSPSGKPATRSGAVPRPATPAMPGSRVAATATDAILFISIVPASQSQPIPWPAASRRSSSTGSAGVSEKAALSVADRALGQQGGDPAGHAGDKAGSAYRQAQRLQRAPHRRLRMRS